MAINKRLIRTNDEGGVASFNTVIWSGDGNTDRSIDVGFAPDWVWVKERNPEGLSHNMYDTLRGAGQRLISNLTAAENTLAEGVKSFDPNGFTVGNSIAVNRSGSTFVAWCWKAGGAAVTNTDGTITSQVSANTEAGFSIVSYTGNSTNGATVGHGLGVEPSMVIFKNRSITSNWAVYSKQVGVDYTLFLNSTDAKISVSGKFSGTNSSVIGLNSAGDVNSNSMIAYCFAEVAGFSKFGSYTGNLAGVTVSDLGFEPAFIMIKRSDASTYWFITDNKRDTTNPRTVGLYPNVSDAELNDASQAINFTSTGFEIVGTYGAINAIGGTFIYMAFANQF